MCKRARPARVRYYIDADREEPELSGQCGQSAHPSEAVEDILTQLERDGLVNPLWRSARLSAQRQCRRSSGDTADQRKLRGELERVHVRKVRVDPLDAELP